VEERFDASGDDPAGAARRALAVAARSLSPNRYVIAVDDERGVLVSHRLVDDRERG
jgi:hypothetical protein